MLGASLKKASVVVGTNVSTVRSRGSVAAVPIGHRRPTSAGTVRSAVGRRHAGGKYFHGHYHPGETPAPTPPGSAVIRGMTPVSVGITLIEGTSGGVNAGSTVAVASRANNSCDAEIDCMYGKYIRTIVPGWCNGMAPVTVSSLAVASPSVVHTSSSLMFVTLITVTSVTMRVTRVVVVAVTVRKKHGEVSLSRMPLLSVSVVMHARRAAPVQCRNDSVMKRKPP